MCGIDLIAKERQRQIEKEGWTAEHDDGHTLGQMADAAACYAMSGWARQQSRYRSVPLLWPWSSNWWNPTPRNRIKELAKAGALIAAEIDRLLRAKEEHP